MGLTLRGVSSSICAVTDRATAPITHEYPLRCSSEHTFAMCTGRSREWWDPRYTATADTLEAVTIRATLWI